MTQIMHSASGTSTLRNHEQAKKDSDPSVQQRNASAPHVSAWVAASAGTGKTKVLTDRVFRLLLPREDGSAGTMPERILCLTFTKAGASEMRLRINERLGEWAVMNDKKLREALEDLFDYPPRENDLKAARRLFARVVDTPGGLKIMTIHSFCQSVLGRFPLEAGLPPHFQAMDEGIAASGLERARNIVLERASHRPDGVEGRALTRLATAQNDEQFMALLRALSSESHQIEYLMADGFDAFYARLCDVLGVDAGTDDIIQAATRDIALQADVMRACARALATGGKTDQERAQDMIQFLMLDENDRAPLFDIWTRQFLTAAGEPAKKLMSVKVANAHPDLYEAMLSEQLRIIAVIEKINAARMAERTGDLMVLGAAILHEYKLLKERAAALDFNDLINRTRDLLKRSDMAGWVLYKLDGGLDHILIDEAQDTNPEQWDIVEALIDDFFSGAGARDETRTVFTVGDEKQSIYSFQRAAPQKFVEKHDQFAHKVEQAGDIWRSILLRVSFRTVPAILDFVDETFSDPQARKGLGNVPPEHISHRHDHPGLVELWPLFRAQTPEKGDPLDLPLRTQNRNDAAALLAEHIARQIARWQESGMILPSTGRAFDPGDVMILVRRRSAFVTHMIRALKAHGIPVSGVDRMVLQDQIAVQDLMAAAGACLLPQDDLTLACLLKSPLVGWDDARLERVALSRKSGESLWDAVRAEGDDALLSWLDGLIEQAGRAHPYEFFSHLLHAPCPADKISGLHAISARLGEDALDPLDEFLNQALSFERDHIPALQDFILWQERGNSVIKRDQEESGGKVRIMTVHASKGLQAPIVILPDTIQSAQKGGGGGTSDHRLIWPDKTGLPVPLWSPKKDQDCALYSAAWNGVVERDDEEYRRLLYVAMTRAEDRLYIAGYQGSKDGTDTSWYYLVAHAFSRIARRGTRYEQEAFPAIEGLDFGDTPPILKRFRNEGGGCREAPVTKGAHEDAPDLNDPAYAWLHQAPGDEPTPPRPLIPSAAGAQDDEGADFEPAALSPLAARDMRRFLRGNLTHRLLQTLPDLPASARRQAGALYLARAGAETSEAIRAQILDEVMAILEHPDYAPLFGPDSRAEVPLTGLSGAQLVSGQVDRIYVGTDEVWIVDYKTNRPPPVRIDDVPAIYHRQLAGYRGVVEAVYPGKIIRTFLLWTDGPRLMEVSAP